MRRLKYLIVKVEGVPEGGAEAAKRDTALIHAFLAGGAA